MLPARTGMRIFDATSIPDRIPFNTTRAQATMTTALMPIWRRNERPSKPACGTS